jgi:chromosome segregation ATPase
MTDMATAELRALKDKIKSLAFELENTRTRLDEKTKECADERLLKQSAECTAVGLGRRLQTTDGQLQTAESRAETAEERVRQLEMELKEVGDKICNSVMEEVGV